MKSILEVARLEIFFYFPSFVLQMGIFDNERAGYDSINILIVHMYA